MDNNTIRNNQLLLFQRLVGGTMLECIKLEGQERRQLSIGAFDTVFTFRNFGNGIPLGRMVRHLFPLEDAGEEINHIFLSDFYPIELLMYQDVFEMASFQKHEGTRVCFKNGKRERFNIEPDWVAPEGLLFRIEWKNLLPKECVLTPESAAKILRKIYSRIKRKTGLSWRPIVRFNGEQLNY